MSESFKSILSNQTDSPEKIENARFKTPLSRFRELKNNPETSEYADSLLKLSQFPASVNYNMWSAVSDCEVDYLVRLVNLLSIPTVTKTKGDVETVRVIPIDFTDESGNILEINE